MLKSKKSSVLCTILTVILLVIIFCFTSLLMYNYFLSDSLNNLNQTGSVSLNCEKAATKNQLNKFIEDGYDTKVINRDVYIFPEITNIKCLSKVIEINPIEGKTKTLEIYVGSNSKLFNLLDSIGNIVLIALALLISSKKYLRLIVLYIIFNLLNYKLLNPVDFGITSVLPILINEQLTNIYFLKNMFILALGLKVKKNISVIFMLYYFTFLSVDYLGIFIICLYILTKFKFNFSNTEKILITILPFMFYLIRVVSGIFGELGYLWIHLGQRVYRGFTVYPDLKATLWGLICNSNPFGTTTFGIDDSKIIQCYDLRGGPLDSYLRISGDVNVLASLIGSISILALLVLFFIILRNFRDHYFLLTLFFISPPLNHLTFYGNDDLIILIITAFCLFNFTRYSALKLFLLLIVSLLNLHPAPLLIGILLVAINYQNKKIILYSVLTNILFASFFLYDLIVNSKNIDNTWLAPGYGYGLYLDVLLIQKYLNFDFILSISIILICLTILYLFPIRYFNLSIGLDNRYSDYFYIPVIMWFVVSFLYTNNTYRIPLFFGLLFMAFLNSNERVRMIILFFIFLEPIVLQSPNIIQGIFMTVSNISSYILLVLFLQNIKTYISNNSILMAIKKIPSQSK
jgi:hypothetical protein